MNVEIPPMLLEMSDEELAFRGWTRDGIRERWQGRIEKDKNAPQIGDQAPDFELEVLSPAGKRTGEMLSLSSLRGKPLGIYFGSFT